MRLTSIDTGFFKLDGGAMFGVVPKSIWHKLNAADDNNMCTWAMRCLLIEDGNRLMLVDTGMGDKQSEKFFGFYYLSNTKHIAKAIQDAGYSPNEITDVILTHLHFDHCGGAVSMQNSMLKPTFEKAVYWSNAKHWKWATEPNAREKNSFLKENMLPLQESGQLKFLTETESISDNVDMLFVSGHTESMMLPKIKTVKGNLIYAADLVPSMAHLPIPYVMGYDTRPLLTIDEKTEILNTALDENSALFFEHDKSVECCTLQRTERGIREKEVFKLSEWISN